MDFRQSLQSFGLCAALVAAGCGTTSGAKAGGSGSQTSESSGAGAQATDFSLRDTTGKMVSLSDYLGKQVVVMDFWAVWCVPCMEELPHLEELYKQNKDKGLIVLGISMDGPETIAQVPSVVSRYGLTFPTLLDEETKVVNLYNPKRSAPQTVIIDRKGTVAKVRSGYSTGDDKLIAAEVQKLLGQ